MKYRSIQNRADVLNISTHSSVPRVKQVDMNKMKARNDLLVKKPLTQASYFPSTHMIFQNPNQFQFSFDKVTDRDHPSSMEKLITPAFIQQSKAGLSETTTADYDKVVKATSLLSHKKKQVGTPDFGRTCPRDNSIYH